MRVIKVKRRGEERVNGAAGTRVTCMGKTETSKGAFGKSDIEGKAAMVLASELGSERVSNEREHMSQRGQRASFNPLSMAAQIAGDRKR